jgi:membrane associated rhomboid family serine protease
MFLHAGLTPLLVNAYALYLFGPRVERQWGAGAVGSLIQSATETPRPTSWVGGGSGTSRRFAGFYLLCGLGGVACQLLFFRTGTLVGASAAVFGVMTAYAMQWPDDEVMFLFVFPVRARSLVVGLLVFNVVMGVAGDGSAAAAGAAGAGGGTNLAYFAHLGGVFAAYVYMRMVSTSPNMDQVRQRVANVPDADEPPRAIPRNPPRRERADEVDDVVAKSKATIAKRVVAVSPSPRRAESRADELDRVLDKISQQGIDSLTSDERNVLEEMSKRLRGRES